MNSQKQFFSIPFGCDLLGKSIDQVLEQCSAFAPQLFAEHMPVGTVEFFADPVLGKQRRQWAEAFGLPTPNQVIEPMFGAFDAHAGFHCHFELQNYQALSYVGIHFVGSTAAECIISLGTPVDPERYRSELEVTKVFLASLEELYANGRMQDETEPATRVYTWKKDSRRVVSFVSRPDSGSPRDAGALLSVQIRDIQLHPDGAYFDLLYNQARRSVRRLRPS